MSDVERTLGQLRERIDAVDSGLLELLNDRAGLAKEVALAKRDGGASFYRPERERALIDKLQDSNRGPFPGEAIRPVFQEIISACLSLEQGMEVAYLGPEATFTHQAVRRHFGTSAKTVPCGTIDSVFTEVARGEAAFGVVPVENSSEGVVNHTLDCFVDSPLRIVAEIVVDVEHCLLARDGLREDQIERVYSHPQALAQCRDWLSANLKQATLVPSSSTADAARSAKEDMAGAAVSAQMAARMYGLSILRRNLQDHHDNVTRFLVVGREQQDIGPVSNVKTSLLMTLPDTAGALLEVLAHFNSRNINLTKIESRPSKRKAWDYVFFLDLDGRAEDEKVAEVLGVLGDRCDLFKVLGTYQKADNHE
ncbi:MAG: prephenate dehydratase [Myxococcales bacterium]|nr:prephenate dehydratase [Myxococcales bacterium]